MRKTLAVLATIASISVLSACGGSHDNSAKNVPASLVGEWRQVESGLPDIFMTASIGSDSIQIDMKANDVTNIYWVGDFKTDGKPSGSLKVLSKGDRNVMEDSLFASQQKNKQFVYANGKLSFPFEIMGTKTTVYLAKQEHENPGTADIPEFDDVDKHKVNKPTKTPTYKAPAPVKTR